MVVGAVVGAVVGWGQQGHAARAVVVQAVVGQTLAVGLSVLRLCWWGLLRYTMAVQLLLLLQDFFLDRRFFIRASISDMFSCVPAVNRESRSSQFLGVAHPCACCSCVSLLSVDQFKIG